MDLNQCIIKGSNLFQTLKVCVELKNIEWNKLNRICTDVAPALTDKHEGCLALFETCLDRPVLNYHSVLHYGTLSEKNLNLKHVMDLVVKCVNKIRRSFT